MFLKLTIMNRKSVDDETGDTGPSICGGLGIILIDGVTRLGLDSAG